MTAAAPSGVVTFLFTDVEGSTRRWEAAADCITSDGKGVIKTNRHSLADLHSVRIGGVRAV